MKISAWRTSLRVLNAGAAVLIAFSAVFNPSAQPVDAIGAAVDMVPFGAALVATSATARRFWSWASLAANFSWAWLYVGVAIMGAVRFGLLDTAVPLIALAVALCLLNVYDCVRSLARR